GPLSAYLDVLDAAWPPGKIEPITFVILPEYVARRWWERILYNQSVKRLRSSLLGRPHTVVVNVPYRREDAEAFAKPAPAPPTALASPAAEGRAARWYRSGRAGSPYAAVQAGGPRVERRVERRADPSPHDGDGEGNGGGVDRGPRGGGRLDAAARRRHRRQLGSGPARARRRRIGGRKGQGQAPGRPPPAPRR